MKEQQRGTDIREMYMTEMRREKLATRAEEISLGKTILAANTARIKLYQGNLLNIFPLVSGMDGGKLTPAEMIEFGNRALQDSSETYDGNNWNGLIAYVAPKIYANIEEGAVRSVEDAAHPELVTMREFIGVAPKKLDNDEVFALYQSKLRGSSRLHPYEESSLVAERDKGQDAVNELTRKNLRLVMTFANGYRDRASQKGIPYSDLEQEGNVGLMRACWKFDYRRGLKFATYAGDWIRTSMRRLLKNENNIRLPEYLQTAEYFEDQSQETGPEKIILPSTVSGDVPRYEDGRGGTFLESLPSDSPGPDEELYAQKFKRDVIDIVNLTKASKERGPLFIKLRFGLDGYEPHTLEQIGKIFGVTRQMMHLLEKQALASLKKNRQTQKLREYLD